MIQTFGRKNVGTKYSIDNVHEVKVYTDAILKQFFFSEKKKQLELHIACTSVTACAHWAVI